MVSFIHESTIRTVYFIRGTRDKIFCIKTTRNVKSKKEYGLPLIRDLACNVTEIHQINLDQIIMRTGLFC